MVEDPPSTKQEVYPFQLFAFRIFDDVTGCLEHKGIRSDLAQEKDRLTLAVASSTRPFIVSILFQEAVYRIKCWLITCPGPTEFAHEHGSVSRLS